MFRGPFSYTDASGLSIAYQVVGEGDRNLVWIPGLISHLEINWELPATARFLERVASLGRTLIFDKRGSGLSDRDLGTGTLEARMDDLVAVMDAAGFNSAHLIGISEGAALGLLMAASNPDRVQSVTAVGSVLQGPLAPGHPNPDRAKVWAADFVARVLQGWGSGEVLPMFSRVDPSISKESRARFERNSATPRAVGDALAADLEVDARPILSAVHCPALIVHCLDDPVADFKIAERCVGLMPDARVAAIDGAFHWSEYVADLDLYADAIETFITGAAPVREGTMDRMLATVVFTDLVQSTATAAALGDAAWRSVLDRHDRLAKETISQYRGEFIKSTGDGILAVFDGPGRAIEATERIREGLNALDLQIRAGVHTGEIHRRGDDISGLGVVVASRVQALAADGEIWVSSTIPGLVVGSALEFADRGTYELKGVPGEWALSAVV